MPLAFSASQSLDLAVTDHVDRLGAYLEQEQRVVGALLDPAHLEPLGDGRYRYEVTRVQVFQLSVQPVVTLQVRRQPNHWEMTARDCELEGLGMVEDFQLTLQAVLEASDRGLQGEAGLAVSVSRPPLLRLIPVPVLEATGRTILNGILLGIKGRVGQQLLRDFRSWCESSC
jgi:hypothetical protein